MGGQKGKGADKEEEDFPSTDVDPMELLPDRSESRAISRVSCNLCKGKADSYSRNPGEKKMRNYLVLGN